MAATIVENFNAGTFPGSASDTGWANAWSGGGGTSGLSSANPINSSGSYYSFVSGSANVNYSIRRQLDSSIFNSTTPYTISWDYRLDSDISLFSGADHRINFGSSANLNDSGSNASTGWLVGVKAQGYGGSALNGYWFFYDHANPSSGLDGPYNESNMSSTGILMEQGKVYSFTLEVDPASKTYSASITVDGDPASTVTQTGLNFRNQTSNQSHLNLYMGQFTTANEGFASSLDNLTINAVPEPGRALLAFVSMGLLIFRRCRR